MAQKISYWRLVLSYFCRALLLRCPLCGQSPLFVPLSKTRSLYNWLRPLDGCPRCGYAYEREPGYFLLAVWAINYGVGSLLGLAIYFFLEWRYPGLPLGRLLVIVLSPIIFFNVFFARHSKALFLAIDLFFDPPQKEKGDHNDRGDQPQEPILPDVVGGHGKSLPLVSEMPSVRELVSR